MILNPFLIPSQFEAAYLVIDVGATSYGSGFMAQSLKCASHIIQRKIFSESNHRYGLVLVGTVKASNDLGYPHVTVVKTAAADGDLVVAEFDQVRYLEEDATYAAGREVEDADWLDGVVVAMDRLVKNTQDVPACKARRIIVLTDMGCKVNDDKLFQITEAVKDEGIEFTFM